MGGPGASDSKHTGPLSETALCWRAEHGTGAEERGVADLQSGNSYGSGVATGVTSPDVLAIPLNEQARADVLAAFGGDFAVGVHLVEPSPSEYGSEWIRFGASSGDGLNTALLLTYYP